MFKILKEQSRSSDRGEASGCCFLQGGKRSPFCGARMASTIPLSLLPVCVRQPSVLSIHLKPFPPVHRVPRRLPGVLPPPPPIASAKLQVCAAALAVCMGLRDTNSGPRTWEANISPTEPSPQPPFIKSVRNGTQTV